MRVGGYSLLWVGGFLFCLSCFSSFVPWWDPLVCHCIHVEPFGCSFDEYICFYSWKKKRLFIMIVFIEKHKGDIYIYIYYKHHCQCKCLELFC